MSISEQVPAPLLPQGDYYALTNRKISKRTCQLYDYKCRTHNGMKQHLAFVRNQDNVVVGCHIRTVETKRFEWVGTSSGVQLFGQHTGKGGTLVITEGQLDCLSIYECINANTRDMIIVSICSGTGSVKKGLEANISFIEQFQRVIIFFDQDEAGQKAAKQAVEVIGARARVVTAFPYKDASEAWMNGDRGAITDAIVKAPAAQIDGVVKADDPSFLAKILKPDVSRGYDYPWKLWNECTRGMRPGEVHLIAAGTGIGKSLFARSICLDLVMRQQVKCAYIGLEEAPSVTYERMISEAMNKLYPDLSPCQPLYLWDEAKRKKNENKIRDVTKNFAQNLYLLDKFGMDSLHNFVATVKHYVLNEQCKVVFLDHFSLLADGIDLRADQRRTIDKAIAELKTLAIKENFTFVIVNHLSRDAGLGKPFEEGGEPTLKNLRGSASLAQIPSYIWLLQRNPMADPSSTEETNVTKCLLKKNRETGRVGWMSSITFDANKYQLTESAPQWST